MNKKILILGAAGFLGTNLTLKILNLFQNDIILYDMEQAKYIPQILMHNQRINICSGNFRKTDDFEALTKDVEVVYHLISTTCPTNSNYDIAEEMEDNIFPTIKLLDACVKNKVQQVVFLSSGGTVYGKEHSGICKECEESFPISSYGIQKIAIEKILYLYNYMHEIDYRIVRLANPYGPYQRTNGVQGVVTNFVFRALQNQQISVFGDGSVVRDYIYIEDAIEAILRLTQSDAKHKIYNVGSGKGHSINEVIDIIENELGKKVGIDYKEARKVDVPKNVLNVERFIEDFGQISIVPLQEGIRKTIEFMKQPDK